MKKYFVIILVLIVLGIGAINEYLKNIRLNRVVEKKTEKKVDVAQTEKRSLDKVEKFKYRIKYTIRDKQKIGHILINKQNDKFITASVEEDETDNEDKAIKIFDLETGKMIKEIGVKNESINEIILTEDEKTIITTEHYNYIRKYDLESGSVLDEKRIEMNEDLNGSVLSVINIKDNHIIYNLTDGKIVKEDLKTSEKKIINPDKKYEIFEPLIISKNKESIITATKNKILLYSVAELELNKELIGHTDRIRTIALFDDENKIISGGTDNTIRVWDIGNGQEIKVIKAESYVNVIKVLDNKDIVFGEFNGNLNIYDIDNNKVIDKFKVGDRKDYFEEIMDVAVSKNLKYIVFSGSGGSIVVLEKI